MGNDGLEVVDTTTLVRNYSQHNAIGNLSRSDSIDGHVVVLDYLVMLLTIDDMPMLHRRSSDGQLCSTGSMTRFFREHNDPMTIQCRSSPYWTIDHDLCDQKGDGCKSRVRHTGHLPISLLIRLHSDLPCLVY